MPCAPGGNPLRSKSTSTPRSTAESVTVPTGLPSSPFRWATARGLAQAGAAKISATPSARKNHFMAASLKPSRARQKGTQKGRTGCRGVRRALGDLIMRISNIAIALSVIAGSALGLLLLSGSAFAVQDQPTVIGGVET